MPHARHGGSGVWMVAEEGSKLAGTGFEKLQMGHTQVALLGGAGSCGRRGLCWRCAGDAVALREETLNALDPF